MAHTNRLHYWPSTHDAIITRSEVDRPDYSREVTTTVENDEIWRTTDALAWAASNGYVAVPGALWETGVTEFGSVWARLSVELLPE